MMENDVEKHLIELHNETLKNMSDEFQQKIELLQKYFNESLEKNKLIFDDCVNRVIRENFRLEERNTERDKAMSVEYSKMIKSNLVAATAQLIAQGHDPLTAWRLVNSIMKYET